MYKLVFVLIAAFVVAGCAADVESESSPPADQQVSTDEQTPTDEQIGEAMSALEDGSCSHGINCMLCHSSACGGTEIFCCEGGCCSTSACWTGCW